jgi:hypothetical protein
MGLKTHKYIKMSRPIFFLHHSTFSHIPSSHTQMDILIFSPSQYFLTYIMHSYSGTLKMCRSFKISMLIFLTIAILSYIHHLHEKVKRISTINVHIVTFMVFRDSYCHWPVEILMSICYCSLVLHCMPLHCILLSPCSAFFLHLYCISRFLNLRSQVRTKWSAHRWNSWP